MTTHGYTIPKITPGELPTQENYYGRETWCGKNFKELETDYTAFVSPHKKEVDCKDCLTKAPKDEKILA